MDTLGKTIFFGGTMKSYQSRRTDFSIAALSVVFISQGALANLSAKGEFNPVAQGMLDSFVKDPKSFMNDQKSVQKFEVRFTTRSAKRDGKTFVDRIPVQEIPLEAGASTRFSDAEIASQDFVKQKNAYHEGLGKTKAQVEEMYRKGRAEIDWRTDNPKAMLGGNMPLVTLAQMDRYRFAKLPHSPWSGDYWPIYSGGIAKRYADPRFLRLANGKNWDQVAQYIINQDIFSVRGSSMDLLSPAEKYDLLLQDGDRGMTQSQLLESKGSQNRDGSIDTWMGKCHGWAAASYNVKRPAHGVDVMSMDGKRKIRFYPTDIKALYSLLWSQVEVPNYWAGQRCDKKDPVKDSNGRIIDPACFDSNPGTWHQVVVNQIGVHKRSFIIDATYDFEVWNQPIYSYEYSYFNPQTGRMVRTLKEASIDRSDFSNDKFRKYRSPQASRFVGIAMKILYGAETNPNASYFDGEANDRFIAVNYLYDLELNDQDQIIGGEWYHNAHPDFMWNPIPGYQPKSVGDLYLAGEARDRSSWRWARSQPMPESWMYAATKMSSPAGQPLARIVDALNQEANSYFFGLIKRFKPNGNLEAVAGDPQ